MKRLSKLTASFLAGLAGTMAHLTLMTVKQAFQILPQFQPYEEFQRVLTSVTGGGISPLAAFLLSLVNGSLVLGFVFGRAYRWLPGKSWIQKGLIFGGCAWFASGLLLFPAIGRGLFALGLGLGIAPALLMFVMLNVYSLTMSFAYHALTE